MQIELKKLKASKRDTQETPAYSAELWIDGALVGIVSNDGHGGADRLSRTNMDNILKYEAASTWLAANRPPIEIDGMSLTWNIEMYCHDAAFTKMGM